MGDKERQLPNNIVYTLDRNGCVIKAEEIRAGEDPRRKAVELQGEIATNGQKPEPIKLEG